MKKPSVHLLLQGEHVHDRVVTGYRMLIEPLTSSSVLIVGEAVTVFDTGTPAYWDRIAAELALTGVRPEDVEYVVVSHGHPDHYLNAARYPNATLITDPYAWHANGAIRCDWFVDPIRHPDWEIVLTPGHAGFPVHISLLVHGMWRGEEKKIVLAGDAFREDLWREGYYHGPEAKPGELTSATWVVETAQVIIPGHYRVLEEEDIKEYRTHITP